MALAAAALVACSETPGKAQTDMVEPPAAAVFAANDVATDTGLAGTLLTPLKARTDTLALIIPGSGPTDRDGNGPMITTDAYRLLAEALAESGVPSLRVDKRGMFGSASAGDPNAVTLDIYREDMAAWLEAMDRDCAVLVGHSEGGLVALHSADLPGVCGVVLLATPGRKLGDVLRGQLRANPFNRPIIKEAESAIAALERGERVDTADMNPALAPLFREEVQGFLIGMFGFDPAEAARSVDVPLMVVGGGQDAQVTREDFDALASADDLSVWFEGMSHTLKGVDDPTAARSYQDPEMPLEAGLATSMVPFILSVD